MTDWYAPNQQAVGVDPASEEQPSVEPSKKSSKAKKSEDDAE
jgi:hypothetical protein